MESAPPPALIGGRYRVIRLIGRGGMGKVFEVEHVHTGDRLALKVLLSNLILQGDAIERFKREARAATRIKSDHVVRVTDADTAPELGGSAYLVMELLDGRDLEQATCGGPQAPASVALWLRQVSHALDKAHTLGIIHRDLKPENLFLSARDDGTAHVKVLDFGIAKMVAERETTSSGQMIGTPAYMAPEQAVGTPVTPATDRFAMGLIAFRLLMGEPYWRGDSVTKVMHELLYEPMPPPSERGSPFGAAFDSWFATACHRDPTKRFHSARAQTDALCVAVGVVQPPAISVRDLGDLNDTPWGGALATAPTLSAPLPTTGGGRRPARGLMYAGAIAVAALSAYTLERSIHQRRPSTSGSHDVEAEVSSRTSAVPEASNATPAPPPRSQVESVVVPQAETGREAPIGAPPSPRRTPARAGTKPAVAPASLPSNAPPASQPRDPLAEQK